MRQSTAGPSFGHSLSSPVSLDEQSELGPAQRGQSHPVLGSPAVALAAHTSHTINIALIFISLTFLLRDTVNRIRAADNDLVVDEERGPDAGLVQFVDADQF